MAIGGATLPMLLFLTGALAIWVSGKFRDQIYIYGEHIGTDDCFFSMCDVAEATPHGRHVEMYLHRNGAGIGSYKKGPFVNGDEAKRYSSLIGPVSQCHEVNGTETCHIETRAEPCNVAEGADRRYEHCADQGSFVVGLVMYGIIVAGVFLVWLSFAYAALATTPPDDPVKRAEEADKLFIDRGNGLFTLAAMLSFVMCVLMALLLWGAPLDWSGGCRYAICDATYAEVKTPKALATVKYLAVRASKSMAKWTNTQEFNRHDDANSYKDFLDNGSAVCALDSGSLHTRCGFMSPWPAILYYIVSMTLLGCQSYILTKMHILYVPESTPFPPEPFAPPPYRELPQYHAPVYHSPEEWNSGGQWKYDHQN